MPSIDVRIVLPPVSLPETELEDRWASDLYRARSVIYDRATSKIKDITSFKAYLAYPAHIGFQDFVNPNFPRATYAVQRHYIRVYGGGQKWFNDFYSAMVVNDGQKFGERVYGAKTKWFENALPALQTNRPRYLFWGVPEIIGYALVGQKKAEIYFELLRKQYPDYVSGVTQATPVFQADIYLNPAALTAKVNVINVITEAFTRALQAYLANGDDMASYIIGLYDGMYKQYIKMYLNTGTTFDETNSGLEWDTSKHRPAVKLVISR